MGTVLVVALGGAVGAVARFLLGSAITSTVGASFPWATLTVNALGSLVLGVLFAALSGEGQSAQLRLFLTVGLLGAFTTFSAFSAEAHTLLLEGRVLGAILYMTASLVLGLLLFAVGHRLGGSLIH